MQNLHGCYFILFYLNIMTSRLLILIRDDFASALEIQTAVGISREVLINERLKIVSKVYLKFNLFLKRIMSKYDNYMTIKFFYLIVLFHPLSCFSLGNIQINVK